MENLENEKENEKEKDKQIQWNTWLNIIETGKLFVKEENLPIIDLNAIAEYVNMSLVRKFAFQFGVKQTCVDKTASIKGRSEKLKIIKERIELFINDDEDFLPQGRKKLTSEEKLALKAKKVEDLVQIMIQGGMKESIAISIAKKTFK